MNDKWKEMQDLLAGSYLSTSSVNLILRNYQSIDEIVKRGDTYLASRRGLGGKHFKEISQYLFDAKVIPEKWDLDVTRQKKMKITGFETDILHDRYVKQMTLEEIGKKYNFTRRRASQLIHRINQKVAAKWICEQSGKVNYVER